MNEIKLPPLPEPDGYIRDGGPKGILIFQREPLNQTERMFHSTDVVWRSHAMQAYATAAIKADRKRTADLISVYREKVRALEAENYSLVSDLDEQQCSDFWAWIRRAYREPESAAYTVYNMEVAYQAGRGALMRAYVASKYGEEVPEVAS